MNDNHTDQPYCEGGSFNIIDPTITPAVARNIAAYYANKDEPWAHGMARRWRAAANDNHPQAGRMRA